MTRRKYLIGNWKMFKTLAEAERDFVSIANEFKEETEIDIGIACNALALARIAERRASSPVKIFAQNVHWEKEGAFTGEISTAMLKASHIDGALVGHSERRQMFGETNATVGKRTAALLKEGMEAILCIGETLEERDSGRLETVLKSQVEDALEAGQIRYREDIIGADALRPRLTFAYEPVWAIGTGRAASAAEAQDAHALIRDILKQCFGEASAKHLRILYGGSVKPDNVANFLRQSDIDGALVGGASLTPGGFAQLVRNM